MKTVSLKLTDINTTSGTQTRAGLCDETITDYAERMKAGDKFPPVVVFFDGAENFMADGFHRYESAGRAGKITIQAKQRKGTRLDALWYGLGANRDHNALRITGPDKRHAIQIALETFPDKTQEAVAKQVGCARSWVAMVKKEVVSTDKLTPPTKVTGKDGKSYPTTYAPRKKDSTKPMELEPATNPEASNPTAELAQSITRSVAMRWAEQAITTMQNIRENDPERIPALTNVRDWINEQLQEEK